MKYRVIRIAGLLMLLLGLAFVFYHLLEREKSVVASVASGGSLIALGAGMIGSSVRLERKNERARTETPNY